MASEPLPLLSRALDQMARVIAGVGPEQGALPTPCRSWNVAALVAHIVHVLDNFTVAARGGTPDYGAATPDPGPDPAATFRDKADGLLAAWRAAGDLGGTVELPWLGEKPARFPVDQQTTELAAHAWDLASATGQDVGLDEELGRFALDWARSNLRPEFRGEESEGKAFGPEIPVSADAPVYDRLAAFFGRQPDWFSSPP